MTSYLIANGVVIPLPGDTQQGEDGLRLGVVQSHAQHRRELWHCAGGDLAEPSAQVHQHMLVEHVSLYNPEAVERLCMFWQGLMLRGVDSVTVQAQASQLIYGEVRRQALMMAFLDNFWLIGLLSLACLPLILLMRKSTQTAAVGGH